MKKERLYFPHDYNARTDPKLQNVLMELGLTGIGLYWCIVEQLYEQDGYLPMTSLKSIAFTLHAEAADVEKLINDFGLFEHDEDIFWSESVNRRILQRNQLLEKRRSASKKANQVRWHGLSETEEDASQTENVVIPNGEQTENKRRTNGEHKDSDSFPIQYNTIKSNEIKEREDITRTHEEFFERFFRVENQLMLEKTCIDFGTDMETLKSIAQQITTEWTLTEQTHKDYNDASRHLLSLIQKRLQTKKVVKNVEQPSEQVSSGTWSVDEEHKRHQEYLDRKKNSMSREEYLKLKAAQA